MMSVSEVEKLSSPDRLLSIDYCLVYTWLVYRYFVVYWWKASMATPKYVHLCKILTLFAFADPHIWIIKVNFLRLKSSLHTDRSKKRVIHFHHQVSNPNYCSAVKFPSLVWSVASRRLHTRYIYPLFLSGNCVWCNS